MTRRRLITSLVICTAFSAGVALASWYDEYDAGLNAIKAGQWKMAVEKMSAAIAGSRNENNNARRTDVHINMTTKHVTVTSSAITACGPDVP